jgi:hypothetical protein
VRGVGVGQVDFSEFKRAAVAPSQLHQWLAAMPVLKLLASAFPGPSPRPFSTPPVPLLHSQPLPQRHGEGVVGQRAECGGVAGGQRGRTRRRCRQWQC